MSYEYIRVVSDKRKNVVYSWIMIHLGEETNSAYQLVVIEDTMIIAVFLKMRKFLQNDVINEFETENTIIYVLADMSSKVILGK